MLRQRYAGDINWPRRDCQIFQFEIALRRTFTRARAPNRGRFVEFLVRDYEDDYEQEQEENSLTTRHHFEDHAAEVFRFRQRRQDGMIECLFETP